MCDCTVGFVGGFCDLDFLGRNKSFTGQCEVMSGDCAVDFDECLVDNGGCDYLVSCDNNFGGWECGECPVGYSGYGDTKRGPNQFVDGPTWVEGQGCYRTCDSIYLGENVGWANVFDWYDGDESCHLNMEELDSVCDEYFEECLAFLGVKECEPMYLGVEVGYVDVFKWNDQDGSCELDETELDAVCIQFREACCSFISSIPGTCEVQEPAPAPAPEGECPPMFLGNDIGWANVFTWHDVDKDCQLNLGELVDLCADFYEECLAFLYGQMNQPALEDQCEPVYLGEDVAFVEVFQYYDNGDCDMDADEVAAMCAIYEDECLAFIGQEREQPACDPIYLGEGLGWTDVISYYDDGDCILQADEILAMCEDVEDVCRQFIDATASGGDCTPAYLGPETGWVDVFRDYAAHDGQCTVDIDTLAALCAGSPAECAAFGDFSTCEPTYLGPGIGFASILFDDPRTNATDCIADLHELAVLCEDKADQCLKFLEAGQCEPVRLPDECPEDWVQVAGAPTGCSYSFADVFEFDESRQLCILDPAELAAVCPHNYEHCLAELTINGCPAGFYDDDSNSTDSMNTSCVACGPGQFSANHAVECTPCQPGYADTDNNPSTPCQRCAAHFESTEGSVDCTSAANWCQPVYLGPHIGVTDISDYSEEEDECFVDDDHMLAVCGQHYVECLAFLQSNSENEYCDPTFMGEDIGWAQVYHWDEEGSCTLDETEMAQICGTYVAECLAYIHHNADECAPMYLGEATGWAVVSRGDLSDDGSCEVDDDMVVATCGDDVIECYDHINPDGSGHAAVLHGCPPSYFGESMGYINVMQWNQTTARCEVDYGILEEICSTDGKQFELDELEANPCHLGCTDPFALNFDPDAVYDAPPKLMEIGCHYECAADHCTSCPTQGLCTSDLTESKCVWLSDGCHEA
jgi:hypothetical protein